jgi:primosomal protein N' (replication factor Y) (superfamily II helicase)
MKPQQILKVALPTPLRRLFDYLPPTAQNDAEFKIGTRVKVPFGKHSLTGFIMAISDHSEVPTDKLKAIHKQLDTQPIVAPEMMRLYRWCSHYYQHPLGETLTTALPTSLHKGQHYQPRQEVLYRQTDAGAALPSDQFNRAPKQAEIMALARQHPDGLGEHIIQTLGLSASALKALLDKQWLDKKRIDVQPPALSDQLLAQAPLHLNEQQQHAVTTINAGADQFNTYLLEGVTGSGKTEVYLHCIEETLKQGKAALVLVPEIGLTPQTVARFKQRFNVPIITLHSGLTDHQRLHDWMAASRGHSPIIIGTRSAIFTPIKNLGLIVIDEEHDLSFKQHEGLRYHARDVAVMRASQNNIPIILGSATPSLESLHNCHTSRYQLLPITQRAGGANAARFELIDVRSRPLEEGFSQPLLRLIKTHLAANNQVLVFLNRRGFSPTLMCHHCGWMANCTRCESRYTLHLNPHQLRCHHCDSQRPVPSSCPDCHHAELHSIGVGTERSEHFIKSTFPDVPVMRIDRDSTRRKNALQDMLNQINSGDPCILLGTQMLAKGHHFPNVTLVAILEADGGFFSADFRGLERMSQLITQVGGRAGRAEKPGVVAIQTHQADNPLLTTLVQQGYSNLSQQLLKERQQAQLPPYQHAALLRAEAVTENTPADFLQQARDLTEQLLSQLNSDVSLEIFGPIPAVMFKRAGRYRMQLMLQSTHRKTLQILLSQLCPQLEKLKVARKVRWSIDVDPQESF